MAILFIIGFTSMAMHFIAEVLEYRLRQKYNVNSTKNLSKLDLSLKEKRSLKRAKMLKIIGVILMILCFIIFFTK